MSERPTSVHIEDEVFRSCSSSRKKESESLPALVISTVSGTEFCLVSFGDLVFACNVVDYVARGIGLTLVRPFTFDAVELAGPRNDGRADSYSDRR